jgi:hypothetical protein
MVVPLSSYVGTRERSGYPCVTKDGEPFASPWMVATKHGHPYHWEWWGPFPTQGQLALALLLEVCSSRLAIALHQAFAWECLQNLDKDNWSITTGMIVGWVYRYLAKAEAS